MNVRSDLFLSAMRFSLFWLALLLPAAMLTSCNEGQGSSSDPKERAKDSLAAVDSLHRSDSLQRVAKHGPDSTFPEIKYSRVHLKSRVVLDSIRKLFARSKDGKDDNDPFRILITMNRKEFGYIRVGDTIIAPDSIANDLRAYSVFPRRYPAADTIKKIIVLSNAMQSYACYEYGRLVRFAATNTGTERKPTLPGRYALNWKERLRISSLNDNWKLPYTWNYHLHAGNAFHQFTMPGRPVSHSCSRQFMTDAIWLFEWGEGGHRDAEGKFVEFAGTPVIIIDMFDFKRPKGGPWLDLASNRDGILKLPDHPMGVEEALIPISQVPHSARGGLPNRQRFVTADSVLKARGVIRPDITLSGSINYNALRKGKDRRAAPRKPRARPAASVPSGPQNQ